MFLSITILETMGVQGSRPIPPSWIRMSPKMHLCDKAVKPGLLYSGMIDVVTEDSWQLSVNPAVSGDYVIAVDSFRFCCSSIVHVICFCTVSIHLVAI